MRNLFICLLLALSTWAVYWPVSHFSFVNYDDENYVYENPHIAQGLTATNVRWAFQSFEIANYHPLTWVSWLLDSSLFGVRPGPFHVESALLHMLNALLLFEILRRATQQPWPAAFVAAVFALHPLHVESVAWVSERKDVLSTFFLLLAILAYLAYARSKSSTGKSLGYIGAIGFYICGLLAKPMIVTFPFLLLLLDFWPLRRIQRRYSILEKTPFIFLSAVSCIVTYHAQRAGGAVLGLATLPFSMRLENAGVSYVRYLSKTVWPINLSPYYPYQHDLSALMVIASDALLIGITLLCIRTIRTRPYLLVGWFWFLGTLVPVIGLVQAGDQSIADRYMYIPLIGVAIAVGWTCFELCRSSRNLLAIGAALVLVASAITARHQLNYWSDTRTLFDHALRVINGNAVAHVQLGYLDAREGNTIGALDHYTQAIQLNPGNYVPEFDLGNLLLTRNPEQAIAHYQRASELNPKAAKVQYNWGKALLDLGKPGDAYTHFQAAIRIDPDYLDAHYALAQILFASGYYDSAASEFQTVLRIDPGFAGATRGLKAIATIRTTKPK